MQQPVMLDAHDLSGEKKLSCKGVLRHLFHLCSRPAAGQSSAGILDHTEFVVELVWLPHRSAQAGHVRSGSSSRSTFASAGMNLRNLLYPAVVASMGTPSWWSAHAISAVAYSYPGREPRTRLFPWLHRNLLQPGCSDIGLPAGSARS